MRALRSRLEAARADALDETREDRVRAPEIRDRRAVHSAVLCLAARPTVCPRRPSRRGGPAPCRWPVSVRGSRAVHLALGRCARLRVICTVREILPDLTKVGKEVSLG